MKDTYDEFYELMCLIQDMISDETLIKNPKGKYSMNKKFPDCSTNIYATGSDCIELAYNMLKTKEKHRKEELKTQEEVELERILQERIDKGTLNPNKQGIYKVSKRFPDFSKSLYANGANAYELAKNLIRKKKEKLAEMELETQAPFYMVAREWFYIKIKNVGLSDSNIKSYKSILNGYILPYFKDEDMNFIDKSEVQDFLNDKSKEYGYSYVKRMKNIIINIFEYAEENYYIDNNKIRNLTMPKCQETNTNDKRKDPVRKDELICVLKLCSEDVMMQLIIVILYMYGLRTVELVNLKWENFNYEENYFRIEKSKYTDAIDVKDAESTKRYLPLSPVIIKLLNRYKNIYDNKINITKEGFMFTKPFNFKTRKTAILDTVTLDVYFKNMFKKNLELRMFTPYAFRRGVVTRLNAMNYNDSITQMFIGHKPREIKDRYYSKMNFKHDLRPAFEKYITKTNDEIEECLNAAGIKL